MKFAAFLLVGMLVTLAVQAAPANSDLSWEAPTTRVDGTPLDPADIAEYRVYYTINGEPQGVDPIVVSGTSASETVTLELTPRVEPYVISFAITTVDTDGLESAQSETVSKTFQVDSTAAPSSPTNLQFTIVCGDGCTITEKTGITN
jgi:hypothetical protein